MYDPNNIEESLPKNDFSLPKLIGMMAGVAILTYGITKYIDTMSSSQKVKPAIASMESENGSLIALERLGMNVVSSFFEDGLKGHGILYQGQPMVAYEVPGSDNIIIGDVISRHGTNLTQMHTEDHVISYIGGNAWPHLEASDYVIDQDNDKGPILYTITDPNCPYCLRLWETLSPVVADGDIQVRHVMVGILGNDSVNKAAAILESDNSADTLHSYKTARSEGNDYPLPAPSQDAIDRVMENNEIMRLVGASGTPASYIKYPNGSVEFIPGAFGLDKAREIIKKAQE